MDRAIAVARKTIAVVGNPNTGKTTLFNALTGLNQRTGNFPGCTVEKKMGRVRVGERELDVLDLPGTYSLAAVSPDELVVPDVLLGTRQGTEPIGGILVVADAASLHRNLYLVSQLMELDKPMIMALNMIDLAGERAIEIDTSALSEALGIPVIPTNAHKSEGLDAVRAGLADLAEGRIQPPHPQLLTPFRHIAGEIANDLTAGEGAHFPPMLVFRALFDESRLALEHLGERFGIEIQNEIESERDKLNEEHGPLIAVEARERYGWIREVEARVVKRPAERVVTRSDKLDRLLTHKVLGLTILLLVMAVLFQTIYTWAGPLMDGIDAGIGALGGAIGSLLPEGMLRSLIVDGIIAGVGAVLVFLPQIILLFLFIALLEDCGYMARAAFLMDRIFAKVGLSGKSLIPLLSSFACAIPGLMATRTIEHPRDRFTTILIAPLMSCSARLPVYVIMISAFIPEKKVFGFFGLQGLTLLGMYLVGVIVAVPTAWILKRTILKGQTPPFLMELPAYKMPSPRTVGIRVFQSGLAFIQRAGTVILAVTILVWALSYFPRPQRIADEYAAKRQAVTRTHFDERLAALVEFDPARFRSEMTVAEVENAIDASPRLRDLAERQTGLTPPLETLREEWASADRRLAERMSSLSRDENGDYLRNSYIGRMGRMVEPVVEPLGWDWRIGMATIASFPAREIIIATLGVIFNLGDEQDETSTDLIETMQNARKENGELLFSVPVALSIMVFFALCAQCAATLATIRKETGHSRYAVLSFVYMTVLAYLAALGTYHLTLTLGWG